MSADGHNSPSADAPDDLPFDLRKVSWGYQQLFEQAIRRLIDQGAIDPAGGGASDTFFQMLDRASPGSFDHVVKEFLAAVNPRTRWLLKLPGVFEDLCELGWEIASDRLARGIAYFRYWGQGHFGRRPDQVRAMLGFLRRLREADGELAEALMGSYPQLLDRLSIEEVGVFVNWVIELHRRNPRTAIDCAALRLQSAHAYLDQLTRECRLEDVADRLGRFCRAVLGRQMHVGHFGLLDSDHLILRGSRVVAFADHLYLPVKMLARDSRQENRQLYMLAGLTSAAGMRWGGFPAMQGEGSGRTGPTDVAAWLGDPSHAALFALADTARVIGRLRREMPGAAAMLQLGLEVHYAHNRPRRLTDRLLAALIGAPGATPPAEAGAAGLYGALRQAAADCDDAAAVADRTAPLVGRFAGLLDGEPEPLLFYPDYYYPAELSEPPDSLLVADLKAANRPRDSDEAAEQRQARAADADGDDEQPEQTGDQGPRAGFVYPEWNQHENDYYQDWCILRERRPKPIGRGEELWRQWQPSVDRARRMFERLRPELMRKEKYLTHGDEINIDQLVAYLAERREWPAARAEFYEKKYVKQRDLAAALLLDVSGSTANEPGQETARHGSAGGRIIDLEKQAAMILGEGLDALGDDFGLYGFSGNGREQCDFYIYKELAEPFDHDAHQRLLAAFPAASTRIGVALRHVQTKLADHPARRKLVILITDGKPQDSDYDPATRYAQYDVRMAVQEASRQDIHVVCLSTQENSRADLEIMFPQRRFVILEDMRQLVDVLPKLYLKMTT